MKKLALLALLIAASPAAAQQNTMSFFITSAGSGDGAKLGGLSGADARCKQLADASGVAGVAGKTWHAYLSAKATGGQPAVNAKDRIGRGPWYNAKGVMVAQNVADLHSENNKLGKENSLTEKGMTVKGRGDTPNQHDILTGALMDGTLSPDTTDTTCNNWTSNSTGAAYLGHFDRQGGGANPTSWNSAHLSRGCSQENLVGTGGNGYFYCFAIN